MTIEPPQPPTAPAPAIRPAPPKPPHIDRSPFVKDSASDAPQVNREVDTPENMARDAVANGSGALTKRTVNADEQPRTVTPTPRQENPLPADTQSDYDRGQDVLREFRALDARENQSAYSPPAQTSAEQTTPHVPKLNYDEGHGGAYWIFTLVFVAVATFIIAKKFLFTDKPALTKAELFDDNLKATAAKPPPKPVEKPAVKPARTPEKTSDEKRPRFEVRV